MVAPPRQRPLVRPTRANGSTGGSAPEGPAPRAPQEHEEGRGAWPGRDAPRPDTHDPVVSESSVPHRAVDHLAEQVGVAVMAGLLLDHVIHDPAQARMGTVGPGHRADGELIE